MVGLSVSLQDQHKKNDNRVALCSLFKAVSQKPTLKGFSLHYAPLNTNRPFCHEMFCMDSLWSIDLLFVYVVFSL